MATISTWPDPTWANSGADAAGRDALASKSLRQVTPSMGSGLLAHGVRRGNPAEAQKRLAVAERLLRLHRQLVHIIAADDKFDTARIEQP